MLLYVTFFLGAAHFVVPIFMTGPKFGVYCMKHLLLPMLQSWLRSGSRKYGYWDVGATNFKQCCGHTTDLVVDMIHDFKSMFFMDFIDVVCCHGYSGYDLSNCYYLDVKPTNDSSVVLNTV